MATDSPTPRHKVGRPKLPGEGTPLSATVQKQQYDRIYQIARDNRVSISAVVRQILTRGLQRS